MACRRANATTDPERAALGMVPKQIWTDAVDADGGHRDGAGLAEVTGLLPPAALAGYPDGTRVIVPRERPHPGGQLDLMETRDGWRYTCFATDTRAGQLAFLGAVATQMVWGAGPGPARLRRLAGDRRGSDRPVGVGVRRGMGAREHPLGVPGQAG